VVAAYVAEMADPPDDRAPSAVSTITRRLAAIGEGHKAAGHPNPCTDELGAHHDGRRAPDARRRLPPEDGGADG